MRVCRRASSRFGGVDIVLANAGTIHDYNNTWLIDDDSFRNIVDVNLVGVCTRGVDHVHGARQPQRVDNAILEPRPWATQLTDLTRRAVREWALGRLVRISGAGPCSLVGQRLPAGSQPVTIELREAGHRWWTGS
jgi:NAD(P)-dependent dehydrogenase (short-subunit alcohol dehydrogenase family)